MKLEQKINLIKENLKVEGYAIAAKECVGIIEQVFRELLHQQLTQLKEKDRINFQKAELDIGKGKNGIESFTMGQLIGVLRISKFLDAWAHVSKKDLSSIRMINLDELNSLRNKLIHEGREAV